MPHVAAHADDSLWLTRRQIATLLGISVVHFDAYTGPYVPKDARRGKGASLRYYAPAVIQAWLSRREQTKPREAGAAREPESPSLERQRTARAEREEMELARLRGQLVPLDELEPSLLQFAGILRRAGDVLKRNFGEDAADVLNSAVEEAVEGWVKLLDRPDDHCKPHAQPAPEVCGGGADTAPADDAAVRGAGDRHPERPARRKAVPVRVPAVQRNMVRAAG